MTRPISTVVCTCVLLGCVSEPDFHPDEGEDEGEYEYEDQLAPTQSLASPRSSHAAISLQDGRVMLVGGARGAPSQLGFEALVAEVELYDPETESFAQGAALESPRSWPSATMIDDGRVVVLGGNTLDPNTFTIPALAIEVWDPASESFSTVGELPSGGVLFHCAVPLGGDVLVIDECYPGDCTPLRIEPNGGLTTLGGDPTYRYGVDVDCAALPDGRVLLAGGMEMVDPIDMPADHAEIYDPETESFELVGPMSAAHGYSTKLVTLLDGNVLILGAAVDGGSLGHIYSPSTGEFTPVDGEVANRAEHTLTVLLDGRVLIVGGVDATSLELAPGLDIFDPTTGGFTSLSPSFAPRKGHAVAQMASGPVLITGGQNAVDQLADAYVFR